MLKYLVSLIFLFFSTINAYSITFKNYGELNDCIDFHFTFFQYKNNLQNCFKEKEINIDDKSMKFIRKEGGIIQDIVDLKLPELSATKNKKKKKLSEILNDIFKPNPKKIAEKENIFNKPSIFSSDYNPNVKLNLNNKDFEKLNKYIKKNPEDIYSITRDINTLAYDKKLISEFKRQEILLNIYNSFDPFLLMANAANKTVPNNGTIFAAIGIAAIAGGGGGGSSSTPATLSFTKSTSAVGECDPNVTITANLTKAHSSNVIITYNVSGTATLDSDYTLSSTSSVIVAGSTSASITLNPTNDTTNETSETVVLSASVSGVSTTGNTTTTITIYDYVLKCNTTAFTEGSTAEQNAIKNRASWTTVDQSINDVHPYELFNLHKVHSFSSGATTLTGNGQTIYISDSALHTAHSSFDGKSITMLDDPVASTTELEHGTHVASIAAGVIGGTTHGVAPDANIVFSSSNDGTNDRASDLDTARITHSAVSGNHSWGYCDQTLGAICLSTKTMTELENSASAAGRNVRQQLEAAYWGGGATNYLTALDNFQDSGVIVFANGNISTDEDAAFMGALPYYFNGSNDSIDLSDAWISVMYAEFTGTSMSNASTSDFNRLGNPCGKAKEWCLVVDDRQIGAAAYVDVGGNSVYDTAGGSSMGAPQVSGMIALLSQAFPNHTPEQLTDRLLASANNSWFTPTGATTFTTHGASIKHGYHDTWGHGVPDLYAALSPIISSSNPGSFGFASSQGGGSSGNSGSGAIPFSEVKKLAVSQTLLSTSSSFGDGIINGLKGETAYAYDALNGGFKFEITDFITYDSLTEQKVEQTLDKELDFLNNYKYNEKKYVKDFFAGEYFNFRDEYNKGFSLTLDETNIAIQNFNHYNNKYYKNPFTTENKGVGFNNKFYFFGNDVLIGYNNSKFNPLTNINKDIIVPMETLAMSINFDHDKFDLLSFTTGILREENTFLLSEGSGAFDLNNKDNISNFYGLNISKSLNKSENIYFSSIFANSKLDNSLNSLIVDTSEVLSSSFEISYEKRNLIDDDEFRLTLSQPNRIEEGDMTFRFMGLASRDGILPYQDHKIKLEPSGRQKDLIFSYYKNLSKNYKTGFKAIITDDLGHYKNSHLDTNFLLTTSLTF